MFWRTTKISKSSLLFLAFIGLILIVFVESSLHSVKQRWFDQKLIAAKTAAKAQEVIRSAIAEKRIVIDPITDPNETGIIGEQFTLITTDQGDLDAKLTTTDPNWAAVVVDLLKSAGVDSGSYVAVSYTGSMPAMNIATLAAIEALKAKPVIIASIGASMWGANNPDFAWLDMEKLLVDRGIFHNRSCAASPGGRGDRGGNLSPRGRNLCKEIASRNAVPFIQEKTLDDAISKRCNIFMEHLPEGEKFSVYVNVGGGLASIGSFHNLELLKPGLIKRLPVRNYPIRGAMIRFGEKGIPIIDLREIKILARRYNLPISPHPIPEPPSGGVFFKEHYRTELVAIIMMAYALLTFIIIRLDVKSYIRRRKNLSLSSD